MFGVSQPQPQQAAAGSRRLTPRVVLRRTVGAVDPAAAGQGVQAVAASAAGSVVHRQPGPYAGLPGCAAAQLQASWGASAGAAVLRCCAAGAHMGVYSARAVQSNRADVSPAQHRRLRARRARAGSTPHRTHECTPETHMLMVVRPAMQRGGKLSATPDRAAAAGRAPAATGGARPCSLQPATACCRHSP